MWHALLKDANQMTSLNLPIICCFLNETRMTSSMYDSSSLVQVMEPLPAFLYMGIPPPTGNNSHTVNPAGAIWP